MEEASPPSLGWHLQSHPLASPQIKTRGRPHPGHPQSGDSTYLQRGHLGHRGDIPGPSSAPPGPPQLLGARALPGYEPRSRQKRQGSSRQALAGNGAPSPRDIFSPGVFADQALN